MHLTDKDEDEVGDACSSGASRIFFLVLSITYPGTGTEREYVEGWKDRYRVERKKSNAEHAIDRIHLKKTHLLSLSIKSCHVRDPFTDDV